MLVQKGFVLFALVILLSSTLVSALPDPVQFLIEGTQQAIDIVINVASPLFSVVLGEYQGPTGQFDDTEFFFFRCLLLMLLVVLVNFSIKAVPGFKDRKSMGFLVSVIISVLAVRFMSGNELFYGILLQYGVLGVALLTLAPSVLFFYALHKSGVGGFGRRIAWIFWGILLVVIWLYNFENLSSMANTVYTATIVVVAIMLFFDRDIHRYFKTYDLKRYYGNIHDKEAAMLQAEYMNLVNVDTIEAENRKKYIRSRLGQLNAKSNP